MSDFTDNLASGNATLLKHKNTSGRDMTGQESLDLAAELRNQGNWLGSSGVHMSDIFKVGPGSAPTATQKPAASGGGGGGGGNSGGGGNAGNGLTQAPRPPPEPIKPPAPLNLPMLTLSDGTSTEYQLNRLQSMDSLPMKQAEVNAHERGVASGAIHSSQQAGAAQRAVTDKLSPLAQSEAQRVMQVEVGNWGAKMKQEQSRYDTEYGGYLAKLGFDTQQKIAMTTANTSLSNTLLGSMTSLMNNPDIEFGQGVMDKLSSVFNTAQKNNNVILDMGFTY